MYRKVDINIIKLLESIVGAKNILLDEESLQKYSKDETEDLSFPPEVVVRPSSAFEISSIINLANTHKIPVYPRGGGTGLSGGALAVYGGICLITDKLNKILEIDEDNFQAVAEPGVITEIFQNELEKKGLFYPVDPASQGSCFLGGNIAECSGGPRAAKYGVTRNYVLALEFVSGTGEVINSGSRTIKNVTGYNLPQLIIGSEGTLGVVTKIFFRLLSLPKFKRIILLSFSDIFTCISSVSEFYKTGLNPSAIEFLEKEAVKAAENQVGISFPNSSAEAHLLIEIDGNYENILDEEMEKFSSVAEKFNVIDVIIAEDRKKIEDLWKLRRTVGEAVKSISVYKEEDTVVPRSKLAELLVGVKKISVKYRIRSICYGHAGDGNLHVNILKDNLTDEYWNNNLKNAIEDIFSLTVSLGGTISGEHGIGLTQKEFIKIAISNEELELMKKIKSVFDPNNILNPGKIFP